MPTRAGWSVAGAAGATLLAGRVFGFIELLVIGVTLLALVAAAFAFTSFTPLRLQVSRSVRPARVHVGQQCHVVLAVRNDGRRRTPVLNLRDGVRGTPGASLLTAPVERGGRSTAAYVLPTTQRGVLEVGPLTVELTDAFGLTRSKVVAVGRTTITVYPRIVDLSAPPRTGGADPHGRRSQGLHHEGDEFHSLRPYVLGDDLRRVHWPATAHRDELVVRQLDRRRHGRTTVLLDTRAVLHTEASFETAVAVAASILVAARRRGDEIRLLSTGGHDSGLDGDDAHLDGLLSWLSTVEARTGVAATPSGGEHHGAPVRITTDLDPTLAHRPASVGHGLTIAVITDGAPPWQAPGVVAVGRPDDLRDAWPADTGRFTARARPRAAQR